MAHTDVVTILFAGVIVFAGHFVRGISGFGSALLSVPPLALMLDIKFITPLFSIFQVTSGAILVSRTHQSINWRLLFPILGGLTVGTALGTWVLLAFSFEILKRILGVLVIAWALTTVLREKHRSNMMVQDPVKLYLAPLSGFLGGALGAMFGVNGPPIVIYLSQALDRKGPFRATLSAVLFADACYRVVLFSANHLLTGEVLHFALLMVPFLVAGTFIGSHVQRFIDEALFRKVVAVILGVTGVGLLT